MRKRKLYTFVNRSRHLTLTKMIYIKKSLKNFLFFKYSLYESLIIKWNRAEHSMFGDVSDLTGKRRRNTVGLKNLKNLKEPCMSTKLASNLLKPHLGPSISSTPYSALLWVVSNLKLSIMRHPILNAKNQSLILPTQAKKIKKGAKLK